MKSAVSEAPHNVDLLNKDLVQSFIDVLLFVNFRKELQFKARKAVVILRKRFEFCRKPFGRSAALLTATAAIKHQSSTTYRLRTQAWLESTLVGWSFG